MIEGKATIELTDVHTGQKETVVEKNMVTNAIPYWLGDDVFNCRSAYNYSPLYEATPIYAKLMGGLLLFEEPLEENVENLYAPMSNRCVGCANQEVNTTDNPLRGSLNVSESKELSDGHQFVWDFATSQGNGTISALALTHPKAGAEYWQKKYSNYYQTQVLANWSIPSEEKALQRAFTCVIEINVSQKYWISIYPDFISKELVIEKRYLPVGEITIFRPYISTPDEREFPLLDSCRITPSLCAVTVSPYNVNFFDDGNYWTGLGVKSVSSDGSVIKRIKINKMDFSVVEDEFSLSGVRAYTQFATISAKGQYPDAKDGISFNGILYKSYFYFSAQNNQSQNRVYKLNLQNPNEVLELPADSTFTYYPSATPSAVFNNMILCSGGYAIINDTLQDLQSISAVRACSVAMKHYQHHHIILSFGYSSGISGDPRQAYCEGVLPYLATINNLATPVEKTPDKTMKITYTLRMVDEGAGT